MEDDLYQDADLLAYNLRVVKVVPMHNGTEAKLLLSFRDDATQQLVVECSRSVAAGSGAHWPWGS